MSTDLPPFSLEPPSAEGVQAKTHSAFPFWPRFFAFAIDGLLLGFVGWGLGAFFFDTLAELGPWGRMLGFLIAVLYFAIPESRVGGGQSVGKRLLGLRVVDPQCNPLSFERSFGRLTVFALPFLLNGLPLPLTKTIWIVSMLLGLVVFGVGGGTTYLVIFNRNTRQGLHDLAVGSYVVRTNRTGSVETQPMWKAHWAILGSLLVIFVVGTSILSHGMERWARLPQLLNDVQQVERLDNVQAVNTQEPRLVNASPDRTRKVLIVDVVCARNPPDRESFADQVARIILQNDPKVQEYDVLSVGITRSYNIGIASGWISQRFAHSPVEWNQRMLGSSPEKEPPPTQR